MKPVTVKQSDYRNNFTIIKQNLRKLYDSKMIPMLLLIDKDIAYSFVMKEFDKVDYTGIGKVNYNYTYKGFSIWGLTARIITEFTDKILC